MSSKLENYETLLKEKNTKIIIPIITPNKTWNKILQKPKVTRLLRVWCCTI